MNAMLDPSRRDPAVDLNGALHRRLAYFNRKRLSPGTPQDCWREHLHQDLQMSLIEGQFIESERRAVQAGLDAVPTGVDAFMNWFESLSERGAGQDDPLFDWLANTATLPDMRWFLEQEIAGEAGFDDLIALTQLRMPPGPKFEMGRNYWDELGRGHPVRMHGQMLERTADELQLAPRIENIVWESLALGNLMLGLAANRRYAYQSVGALGAVELTAPTRVQRVNAGLERLGVSRQARSYFILHASLDLRHSRGWNSEVIRPLVRQDPAVPRAIAEGALLRLAAGKRCFDRYRQALMPAAPPYPRDPGPRDSNRRHSSCRRLMSPISFR